MKPSKILATGVSALTAIMLLSGCAGITHEPKVDMSQLAVIDDAAFYNALNAIGIDESEVSVMADTGFSFADVDTEYDVILNLDATSEKNNQYSFTHCVDEATAKALFDYYYDNYDELFEAKDFSGISSHEVGTGSAYILIDGRLDDKAANTYTPYHDAIYLKGDTVIVAIAGNYDFSIEKEINTFLDTLGYPHP